MAADSGSRGTSLFLAIVLLGVGYAVWQVAPLSRRMDAIDRDRLETRDRLQRQIETLRDELARARLLAANPGLAAPPAPSPKARPTAVPASPTAATEPSTATPEPVAAPRVGHVDAETFFASRLLPEDSAIATLLVESVPPPEIARRLKHSVAFIVAKGIQIEKRLADARDTPPAILSALHAAVERAKQRR